MIFGFVSTVHGEYFEGIQCDQDISTVQGLELDHIGLTLAKEWYKKENETEVFGNVKSDIVNYLFLKKKFFGKVYAIIGKENINEILRYFTKEVEHIYANDEENRVFSKPIERRDGAWIFIEPEKIIIFKRYTVHLGQLEILCRSKYEEISGVGKFEVK